MPKPHTDTILDCLFPPGMRRWIKVCAILDGARDERIFRAVDASSLDKSCLYAGRLPFVIQEVAPYLLVLERDDKFTRYLLEEGWCQSWGIFLRTEAPVQTLRRHFRALLKVRDESGRKLIFRWYDPRVLRVYLPTCFPEELQAFFGPVDKFYLEGADSESLLEYRLEGRQLKEFQIDIVATQRLP